MSAEITGTTGNAGADAGAPAATTAPTATSNNGSIANETPGGITPPAASPATPGTNYEQFFTDNGGYERVQLMSKIGNHYLAPQDSYRIDAFLDNLYELSESRYMDTVNKIATDHPEAFQSQLLSRMGTDEALRQSILKNLGWDEKDYNGYRDFLAGKSSAGTPLDPRDQKIAELERQHNERAQRETFAKHEQAFEGFIGEVNSPIAETMKAMSFPMDQSGQLTAEGKNAQRAFQALTTQILSENSGASKLYETSMSHFSKGEYQLGAVNQISLKAAVKDAATQAANQIGQWMAAAAELAQLKAKMNGTTTEPGMAGQGARPVATPNAPSPSLSSGLPGYGRFSAETMRAEIKAALNNQRR